MVAKRGEKIFFCEIMPVDSAVNLQFKIFIEIALSCSVSEINTFLCLTQKFKMVAKRGEKIFFCEIMPVDSAVNLQFKIFIEIALSCSVSEINTFLHLRQKFKMAAKSGGKTIFFCIFAFYAEIKDGHQK